MNSNKETIVIKEKPKIVIGESKLEKQEDETDWVTFDESIHDN